MSLTIPSPPDALFDLTVASPGPPPAPARIPARRLELRPYDLAAALTLERELGVSHGLAQIIVRRGLTDAAAARSFLAADTVHPPEAFTGLAEAAALVRRHLEAGSRIVVHGDYDVDGVCATALMIGALRGLGGDPASFIPSRTEDGYGLAAQTVARLAARGTGLLITVDCGITAVEEVAAARAAGIDVIVTDHHAARADGRLPDALIVHPGVCGYPCAELCGTGVALKLAEALGAPGLPDALELVALATVADLMPLRGENRRLVRQGLAALANTGRPGLRALMAVSRADPSDLDAGTVGFRLAPRINAAGRLRRADAALELLLTDDPARAGEIAAELDRLNAERREVETQILWEAEAQVRELGERPAYVLAAEGWHPGVIGIVASRIVERYHRPALLIALREDGTGQGSGRSIPGFDLLGGLHAVTDRLERYGGHRAAAGLSIAAGQLEGLRTEFEAHAASVLTEDLLTPVERADAVASGGDLGLTFAEELATLEPCGMGNPAPTLLVPGARFEDLRTMGEGRHARFTVRSGGTSARGVKFGCDGQLGVPVGDSADATFRLERNSWNGTVEPRLVLRSVHTGGRKPIEVVGEPVSFLAGVLGELSASLPGDDAEGRSVAQPAGREPAGGSAAEPAGPGREPAGGSAAEPAGPGRGAEARAVLDRRGESPLAVLADALSGGGDVLALCADVPRRLPGLSELSGGFALACHHALERDPALADHFAQVVVLDPPGSRLGDVLIRRGSGYAHLAWGEAELGFSRQMHELEYALQNPLRGLYRAAAALREVSGASLERLLRDQGEHGRPPRVAGRLVRVLAELGLISFDARTPGLAVASAERTELHRSRAFRFYAQRHEEGIACLARAARPQAG